MADRADAARKVVGRPLYIKRENFIQSPLSLPNQVFTRGVGLILHQIELFVKMLRHKWLFAIYAYKKR
jgi:hypothetical protein